MKVRLIAHTTIDYEEINEYMALDDGYYDSTDCDELGEFAGRACYQSFHRPNPATAGNADYLANILKQQHESVLEHASATFYVTGVSRSLTHELIRHRHLSFSELSQRFVNIEDTDFIDPPALRAVTDEDAVETVMAVLDGFTGTAKDRYRELVVFFESNGLARKQAREAARCVMPNATETRIVVTGNLRAWRDVIKKRWHVAADAEIREFAGEVLTHLTAIAPNTFSDFPKEPFGSDK